MLSQIFRLIVRFLLIIPPLSNAGSKCALFSRAGRLADGPQPGQVREYEKLHESILYAELRVGVRDEREGRCPAWVFMFWESLAPLILSQSSGHFTSLHFIHIYTISILVLEQLTA